MISWLCRICSHELLETSATRREKSIEFLPPYHVRFASVKNFNDSQVNVCVGWALMKRSRDKCQCVCVCPSVWYLMSEPSHPAGKACSGVEKVVPLTAGALSQENVSKDSDGRVPALQGLVHRPGQRDGLFRHPGNTTNTSLA